MIHVSRKHPLKNYNLYQHHIHHCGEAAVNLKGGEHLTKFRTSGRKCFYANRNHLLTLLKYPQLA